MEERWRRVGEEMKKRWRRDGGENGEDWLLHRVSVNLTDR